MPSIQHLRGGSRWLCDQASLVYRSSPRTARTTQRNPVRKKKRKSWVWFTALRRGLRHLSFQVRVTFFWPLVSTGPGHTLTALIYIQESGESRVPAHPRRPAP